MIYKIIKKANQRSFCQLFSESFGSILFFYNQLLSEMLNK